MCLLSHSLDVGAILRGQTGRKKALTIKCDTKGFDQHCYFNMRLLSPDSIGGAQTRKRTEELRMKRINSRER